MSVQKINIVSSIILSLLIPISAWILSSAALERIIIKDISLQLPLIKISDENFETQYVSIQGEFLAKTINASLDLEEKIGQMFMVTISTTELTKDEIAFIKKHNLGAVVLLGNNIENVQQVKDLTKKIGNISAIKPFIAVDQEGGTVARIPWDPAADKPQWHIGAEGTNDSAYAFAQVHAESLVESGINTNLAPVLDICHSSNPFLTTRCFDDSAEDVSVLGASTIRSYQDARIISVSKHFPGHGQTEIDSHFALPVVSLTKEELLSKDIKPFQSAIEQDVPMIMTSHILFTQLDAEKPASLSYTIQTELLRNELGFNNIIISDDIRMAALDAYENPATQAILAGTDMMITTHSLEDQKEIIRQVSQNVKNGTIENKRIGESVERILRIKCEYQVLEECR